MDINFFFFIFFFLESSSDLGKLFYLRPALVLLLLSLIFTMILQFNMNAPPEPTKSRLLVLTSAHSDVFVNLASRRPFS